MKYLRTLLSVPFILLAALMKFISGIVDIIACIIGGEAVSKVLVKNYEPKN